MFGLLFAVYVTSVGLSIESPVYGEGEVYRVVDGDTYVINVGTSEFLTFVDSSVSSSNLNSKYLSIKVRMFGIDTPESVHPDKSRNTERGVAVSDFVKEKLSGRDIEYVCFGVGRYGRPLCSLGVDGADFGLMLINQCMSDYIQKYGNHPYFHNEYAQAMAQRKCQ